MLIVIEYFDKKTELLVKHEVIPNCTTQDIKIILMNVYNDERYVDISDEDEHLCGGYKINELIKNELYLKFKMDVDIEKYHCYIAEEYKQDLIIKER